MKKISLFLFMLFFAMQGFSQTAHFILKDNIVTCQILDKDGNLIIESNVSGILDYRKQITTIKFTEIPELPEVKTHKFIVAGRPLRFKSGKEEISGKNSASVDIESPITLQAGNKISVLREDNIVGSIEVKKDPLTSEKVRESISFTKISPLNTNYIFESKEAQLFTATLDIKNNIKLSNIRVICNSLEAKDFKRNNNTISYSLEPTNFEKDINYDVLLVFDVEGEENLTNIEFKIDSVSSNVNKTNCLLIIIPITVIVFLLMCVLLYIKRKNKSRSNVFKDKNGNKFYIKLRHEKPGIGDSASPDGVYESEDGSIYEISEGRIKNIKIRLKDIDNKQFTITLTSNEPQIGDTAVPDGKYSLPDGTTYTVENNEIVKTEKKICKTVEELESALASAEKHIQELITRPTQESYDNLSMRLSEINLKLETANKKLRDVDAVVSKAEETARLDERRKMESKHKREICEKYILINSHKDDIKKVQEQRDSAIKAKEKAEKETKAKESLLSEAEKSIKEQSIEIKIKEEDNIRLKASNAQLKEVAHKKNLHYLFEVEETLTAINDDFKRIYKNITNNAIKDGFINPMLKGVGGLSTGILSWEEDFTVIVRENLEGFFGQDLFTMKQEDVKEILAKKFISNIVKSDSFSKFVRLYQLSTVPFIRKRFLEAGMNLELLNKLYYKVHTLITDFGYTLICPALFEEQLDEQKYQWFSNTNLFTIFTLTPEERAEIKKKGELIIIDVNQIGYLSPWISRKATAVTPDF